MRHRRVYEMLKRAGHSPAKAIEILVDARRGNRHAVDWVRAIFRIRPALPDEGGTITGRLPGVSNHIHEV